MARNPKLHVVDTLGLAVESRFTQLHEHVEGQALPPLRPDFVEHLDRVRAQANSADAERAACDELGDLDDERQAAALARLQVEHARLYGVLFLTDVRGLSLRETGRYLGMDHKTVRRHRAKGMAHIMAWCADERQAG